MPESTSTMILVETPDWCGYKGTPFEYDSSGLDISSGCIVIGQPVGARQRSRPAAQLVDPTFLAYLTLIGRNTLPREFEITPSDAANPVLEMHSAHRPLSDKVREEMSEFEREYSW